MQKAKTRSQILYGCSNLKIVEIQRLFGYTRDKAKRVHDLAMQIDREELGKWIIDPVNPRLETVLKVTRVSFNRLAKQIENADALAQQSANVG